jgi:hypothetical protein
MSQSPVTHRVLKLLAMTDTNFASIVAVCQNVWLNEFTTGLHLSTTNEEKLRIIYSVK